MPTLQPGPDGYFSIQGSFPLQNGVLPYVFTFFKQLNNGTAPQPYPFTFIVSQNGLPIYSIPLSQYKLLNPQTNSGIRVVGLISCAAFFVFSSTQVYGYHAPSGSVTEADVDNAIQALQTNAADLWVVYAHPGAAGGGYADYIDNMIQANIPAGQIVEVYGISTTFAVDYELEIGG